MSEKQISPMSETELADYSLHRRFDRMGRLVGDAGMKKLLGSHVMVIGLGGVGSWAAESLARSGVGELTLVDFDEICVTNFNRQLHALQGLVGQKKALVMAERLRKINPQAQVTALAKFYNAENCAEIFARRPDYVIDAIDNVTAKCHLLAYCRNEGIPVVCSTGSGGRLDPTQIRVGDLGETQVDPLARSLRRILREKYAFPQEEGAKYGIPAVYSVEPYSAPEELSYDKGKGFRCMCATPDNPFFNCDNRNLILGNSSFVTGTFGLFCASVAVRELLRDGPARQQRQ
ncbi:MAG: tRNA threonylcarbamoyladenosine dehydratase [Oligoflexia bacterium]|nr:tRNA threonylcarbamoyladenosine dehydratase [Oligoflexia bacterium]